MNEDEYASFQEGYAIGIKTAASHLRKFHDVGIQQLDDMVDHILELLESDSEDSDGSSID